MEDKPKIQGYRTLNKEELALINLCKQKEQDLLALMYRISDYLNHTHEDLIFNARASANPSKEAKHKLEQFELSEAKRWLELSRTNIEVGFMELVRSIARPVNR